MYLEQVRSEDLQTRRTAPLEEVEGTLLASEPGAEYTFMDAQEEAERQKQRLALASRALAKLTGIQRRRYLLHVGKGLTTREIAAVERVAQQVVDRSILAAKKKIKKFLAETQ
jgi:DNA-directed RNA polymerase specialized sigma24 family protein